MAEPIGIASGILALATFAFNSSIAIHATVQSLQSHPKRVRDLLEETEALSSVLGSLVDKIDGSTDTDFSALKLPLLRCGTACDEFESEIKKRTTRSTDGRTSIRDWAKLKYMGDDIDGFRRLIAGYQLTLNIALTDATLTKATLTAEKIETCRDLIETTTDDLEAHLQNMDEKLETYFAQTVPASESDATEIQRIKDERLSTQACLQICARLSEHVDQLQAESRKSQGSQGPIDPDSMPGKVVNEGLQGCKDSITAMATKLEQHMKYLVDKMISRSQTAVATEEEAAELSRLRDQWEAARQCMAICSTATENLNATVSNIENYATGDAVQYMVSTDGTIIHGRNRGLGWRTRQVGGHISDASLQQLSKDISAMNLHGVNGNRSASSDVNRSKLQDPTIAQSSPEFQERYGRGFKLTSDAAPDEHASSTNPPETRKGESSKR